MVLVLSGREARSVSTAAAAEALMPSAAASGSATTTAMDEPMATRERRCSRVMSEFITIPSL